MKHSSIITLLLLSISSMIVGQELPSQKTERHLQIKGTNIFMIPPVSFTASDNFKGFQDPQDPSSMIMAFEIPGPYSEVSKGFNADMLKTQGMEMKSRKEIKVGNYNGIFLDVEQPANGMMFSKHILIYGDEKSSTLLNGVYVKDSLELGEKIKQSVLSTFVDATVEKNPREALNYSLNEDVGSLKYLAVIGNGFLFNRDLKTPTESIDKASLLTDKSFVQVNIADKKLFCISRLKKYPDDYSVIPSKGINSITIDGLDGFELFATNNDDNNEEMYQVILFDDNGGYYLFVGTYVPGSNQAISDIKNVVQTFERKE
ncbi:hypothetical protein [Dokdonia sp. 4H-3-7-5]|uniref:hypothetical protein n=1 Tax=Dokdonia sp. (strain 4H-3-7-5) TaxID=983548 RepID=UPI00020A70FD|nr:hypothetical protein [Dokdonia sp. 4H-3-7-5]AEE18091.1 hypothetical protein Krodi_0101 [Dokdonia sp. 4H-3-7-5]